VDAQGNIDVVRDAVDLFNADDLDGCVERMAPDFVMHLAELPDPLPGREAWRDGAAMMKQAFPDLQIEIDDIVASDDRVAVRLRLHGTHSGDYLGIPATGHPVSYVSHEFYRLADGKVTEEWICSDTASLFQQLGAGSAA
jgi:steroid delta-isomerase-like uncharacterized protein